MKLKTIKEAGNLKGKTVLLRVDYNVPLGKRKFGKTEKVVIKDDSKIRATLPTINFLMKKGAKIILMTHLGRPKGKNIKDLSVEPIAKALQKILDKEINQKNSSDSSLKWDFIDKIDEGEIVFLENLRFEKGEKENNPKFAKDLSELADIYINDAFAVSHRKHASVLGITKFLPSYAGLLLEQEVKALSKIIDKPKKPFVALLGGAKISTKLGVIKNLLKKADCVMVGGALANNFFKAFGYKIGSSLFQKEELDLVKKLSKSKKLLLPVDVIVGDFDEKSRKVVEVSNLNPLICKKPYAILDIGPETLKMYETVISKAGSIVWGGPMGYFESKKYAKGSIEMNKIIARYSKKGLRSVAGGGETLSVVRKTKTANDLGYLSTGGGAMLEFLKGKILPGINPLLKK